MSKALWRTDAIYGEREITHWYAYRGANASRLSEANVRPSSSNSQILKQDTRLIGGGEAPWARMGIWFCLLLHFFFFLIGLVSGRELDILIVMGEGHLRFHGEKKCEGLF